MKNKFKLKNIVLILLFVYMCFIFVTQRITMHKINNEIDKKEVQLDKAKKKNQKLQDEVKLSKSKDYRERLARERLRFIKEGETPVINNK
ncbi:FtsB family cell division protein [Clostridium oceanicum]|uniref:Septum formation initiator family protein n=1 Tax=Clostridium oceanicum TaxID=1543 RepID=A0ABP3V3W6_9CLOT